MLMLIHVYTAFILSFITFDLYTLTTLKYTSKGITDTNGYIYLIYSALTSEGT